METPAAATYERSRRLANQAMWTVTLQRRRLRASEPEDNQFILRRWADFHFLVVALSRLRRAVAISAQIPTLTSDLSAALSKFDIALPHLKKMRDVAEHIDDYVVNSGRDKNIDRKSLEVSSNDEVTWAWLGFELNIDQAALESIALFETLKSCSDLIERAEQDSVSS